MKETKKYWKGIEQLENTADFQDRASKEFPEYLPINGGDNGEPSRRDFLKLMGFGVAAVSLAACETPVRKAIPYVNKPVDVDPGVANYYASTYAMGNDVASVVVKTREGRPIKIEGNDLSIISQGGTTTQVESSVLSLYDGERLQNPKIAGEDTDWETIDDRIKTELAANSGKISILSYSNCSPSTARAIQALKEKYGQVEHIQYDPISMSGLLDAYSEATGSRNLPLHDFSKVSTIVSITADFLGNWPNQALNNKQFASTRKLGPDKKEMSRLYSFESNLSLTGSNADYRQPIKPSQEGLYVANLYNLLAQKAGASAIGTARLDDTVILEKAANDLWRSRGKSLVVSGSNDKNVQLLVIAINDLLQSYGSTIDLSRSVNTRQGSDSAVAQLVSDVKGGTVGTVIFYNCNPAYDHPIGAQLVSSLGKVKTTISTSDRMDETNSSVKYIAPDHHYLESWNDFEPVTGHITLSQPTIQNIFNTRQAQESFLRWSDITSSYYDFVREGWQPLTSGDFNAFFDKCLHDGFYNVEPEASDAPVSVDAVVVAGNLKGYSAKSDGLELAVYANYSVGDGIQANNPWLQEMPDPITKACWDNYFTVSPRQANENDWSIKGGDMDYKVATLTVNGKSVTAPIIPQPGQAYGTVGLAVGYGRTKSGKVGNGVGVNAYELVSSSANGLGYSGKATLELNGEQRKVAQTQTAQTYAGRETVIQESTLGEYQKDPQAGRSFPMISKADGTKVRPHAVSLWKGHEYPNHHWGMIVDLNSCTGCGTCTVACQTENNIPVVGKEEVLNRREMHWIRIDRYYSSRPEDELTSEDKNMMEVKQKELAAIENPEVTFQPMMCQQCNNAPCETVCPVAATTHSSEGLNQMTYNRCIGTRYCANNCPYKVRRFNWFKYHDNAKFDMNTPMNNDLGKMVLNPDVTVRARGVMEKCTFCVQRIQSGKLDAKKEGRRPVDGEIQTACAKSCPTDALVFGDMKDPESRISKTLKLKYNDKSVEATEDRAYHVLEELRVMPNVWYLTKIRNKDKNDKQEA
ncbi:TAT-variant-translocated molybdopterin oxidoreductase [Ekhidna sp. To15]|uniref:TAT-variant-translocated molybdopterin oxidoreductase n=1 Tax=Ekhidna sp. To15 TaxID=3395267 RepID=UPI003F51F235